MGYAACRRDDLTPCELTREVLGAIAATRRAFGLPLDHGYGSSRQVALEWLYASFRPLLAYNTRLISTEYSPTIAEVLATMGQARELLAHAVRELEAGEPIPPAGTWQRELASLCDRFAVLLREALVRPSPESVTPGDAATAFDTPIGRQPGMNGPGCPSASPDIAGEDHP